MTTAAATTNPPGTPQGFTGRRAADNGASKDPMVLFRQTLDKQRDQIALVLPRHLSLDRLLRIVQNAVRRTPGLLQCRRDSLLAAIMQAAQLGLEPDGVLGLAWLLPFKDQCQLIIGYKGLIELGRRSGLVANVRPEVVRAGDYFRYRLGLEPVLEHVPFDMLDLEPPETREHAAAALAASKQKPGTLLAAYAVVDMKDGTRIFRVVTRSLIARIRAVSRSAAKAESPWQTWEDQMWMKTAIRQAYKFVPLSPEDRTLIEAAGEDRVLGSFEDVRRREDLLAAGEPLGDDAPPGELAAAAEGEPNAAASEPARRRRRRSSGGGEEPAAAPPAGPPPPDEPAGAEPEQPTLFADGDD